MPGGTHGSPLLVATHRTVSGPSCLAVASCSPPSLSYHWGPSSRSATRASLEPGCRVDYPPRWKPSNSNEAAPRPLAPRSLQEMPVECGSLAKPLPHFMEAWSCSGEERAWPVVPSYEGHKSSKTPGSGATLCPSMPQN